MAADALITRLMLRSIRPATARGRGANRVRTAIQLIFFWVIFLAVIPRRIRALERSLGVPSLPAPQPTGAPWALFGLASGLGLASAYAMSTHGDGTPLPVDCARRLVVAGPYRFVRNPMAIAGLTQGACVGWALRSPLTLLYVAIGGALWDALVRPAEEIDLAQRFGAEYQDYQRQVRCWVPARRPYRTPAASDGAGGAPPARKDPT
jgi:protein-S-isoprenylcysteine O-methyltransferase Ste14